MYRTIFCLLAWLSFSLPQQPPTSTTKQPSQTETAKKSVGPNSEKKKRDPEIESFISEARQAPPALAADAMFRIATGKRIVEKAWKIELLEEAFHTASNAQHPYQLWGTGVFHTDTRSGIQHSAHTRIDLNALSLKCRIIQAILPLDTRKARELFEEIPTLKFEAIKCVDTSIPNVDSYYDTLAAVANSAFSAEEVKREEPLLFVQSRISDISSPIQVNPVLKSLFSFKATPSQSNTLIMAFTRALKKLSGEATAFLETNKRADLAGNINAYCEATNVGLALKTEAIEAVRDYLIRHLNAARCGGADTTNYYRAMLERFNKAITTTPFKSEKAILPIIQDELKTAPTEGTVEIVEFWQSPTAKPFLLKLKQLRFGVGEQPNTTGSKALTELERLETKWQKQLSDFLRDFRAWRADHERSEADYFHQKCMALLSLRELVPDDTMREAVLREFISVLSESPLQRDQPIEWLLHVQPLVRHSLPKDQNKIYEMILASGSPSLVLYAKLEKLAPPK